MARNLCQGLEVCLWPPHAAYTNPHLSRSLAVYICCPYSIIRAAEYLFL